MFKGGKGLGWVSVAVFEGGLVAGLGVGGGV